MWHTERQLHIVHTHVTADGPKNKFRPDVQFIKLGICVKPAATGEEFWLVTVTLIIYIGRIIMYGNFPVNIFVHIYRNISLVSTTATMYRITAAEHFSWQQFQNWTCFADP